MFARPDRYIAAYTHKSPSRDDELRLLIEWLAQQPGTGLLLVGPRADSLSHSALGAALVEGRHAEYTTLRQRRWGRSTRVIALWPDQDSLQKLHDLDRINALGVLTWNLTDVSTWAAAVGANDLLGTMTHQEPTISDPTVLGAMRSLTNSVNLSTGIHHPSDHDHAVHTLRALRARSHRLDPGEIETWAIHVGWSSRHAADLAAMVKDIAAGKAKRTHSGNLWKPTAQTIAHWAEVGANDEWKAF